MQKSEIQKWLSKNLRKQLKLFGLTYWKITTEVTTEEQEGWCRAACVQLSARYHFAHITFFHDRIKNTKELEQYLRHELLHILLSPYDLFAEMVNNKCEDPALEEAFSIACEQSVVNLERYVDSIKFT